MTDPTNLDDMVAGEPFEPMMTRQQWFEINDLLATSALPDEYKESLELSISNYGLTEKDADVVIHELIESQIDDSTLARDGRLREKELKIVNYLWCNRPNT